MTLRRYTDRSRILTAQRCPRRRWHEYESGPARLGIASTAKPLPLAVGGSVHVGLAILLRAYMDPLLVEDILNNLAAARSVALEQDAVNHALADFATHRTAGFELDLAERAALDKSAAVAASANESRNDAADAFAYAMGPQVPAHMPLDDEMAALPPELTRETAGRPGFDAYLWREQSALVEALVRAYARRRLRPLLEQYEVLEVEREGTWTLAETYECEDCCYGPINLEHLRRGKFCPKCGGTVKVYARVEFMSRPDALLRNRATNALELLSYKTAASWDIRKARDAERDMQGLSEGVEVERRLSNWWAQLHAPETVTPQDHWTAWNSTQAMWNYLVDLPAPPRILAVRYEYLLKGDRWIDKDLSARLGVDARTQRSHLVRQMVCVSTPRTGKNVNAFSLGDVCWSYEFHLEDGTATKLAPANWRPRPAWEAPGGIRGWIDSLDATAMTMSAEDSTVGQEPRSLGYSGPGQAVGFTSTHPLDECFIEPITVYRNEDELRDLVEQIESSERAVAEAADRVHAVAPGSPGEDPGEYRHLLNVLFPQHRQSCEYPSSCPFAATGKQPGPCFGTEQTFLDPLGTERYKVREPHHEPEARCIRSATPTEVPAGDAPPGAIS